jgi:rare lipoprotein A (peptidoglycan hydrolase)
VVINDRGRFTRGVTLDLTRGAAHAIGMYRTESMSTDWVDRKCLADGRNGAIDPNATSSHIPLGLEFGRGKASKTRTFRFALSELVCRGMSSDGMSTERCNAPNNQRRK